MWFKFLYSISTSKYVVIYTQIFFCMGIVLLILGAKTQYDMLAILLFTASSWSLFCYVTLGFSQFKQHKFNIYIYIFLMFCLTILLMIQLNSRLYRLNTYSHEMQAIIAYLTTSNILKMKPPYYDYVLNKIFEYKINHVYFNFTVDHIRRLHMHCFHILSEIKRCSFLNKYWLILVTYARQINDLSDCYPNLSIFLVSISLYLLIVIVSIIIIIIKKKK